MPTIDDPHHRQHLLEKAELFLQHGGNPQAVPQLVRELSRELALVDGLYTMLEVEFHKWVARARELRVVVKEDVPQNYLTHRLYAMVYSLDEIQEQLHEAVQGMPQTDTHRAGA